MVCGKMEHFPPSVIWHDGVAQKVKFCILLQQRTKMTNSPYLENRKWSRIKIQKNQICLMLPVVTCLDVASSDATRANSYDIQKWWESLRNISQNLLPEISALKLRFPGWIQGLTESLQLLFPGEKSCLRRPRLTEIAFCRFFLSHSNFFA